MNKYIERVIEATKAKNSHEPEFLQTVEEVLTSLEPVIEKHPEYEKAGLLERFVEPERVILFACSRQPMVTLVFLGSCFLASLGMDSCRMPFSNLAVTSSGSTPSPT